MKRKLFLLLLCLVCAFSISSFSVKAANYTNATNTFNTYLSSGYRRLTNNNSGATMKSILFNGNRGNITFKTRFDTSIWSFDAGTRVEYRMPNGIYEGARIELWFGGKVRGVGKVHTYNNGRTFGSITKLDSFGGGYYLKYN